MLRNYGGIIWTNHALERLKERGITQNTAYAVWKNPDKSRYSKSEGGWIYSKKFGSDTIEVVAKKNEQNEWIIISVWNRERIVNNTQKFSITRFLFRLVRRLFT